MPPPVPAILTVRDYSLLESRLHREGRRQNAMTAALGRKLQAAVVVSPSEIGPEIVTLNSRVRYRIGWRPPEERTIVSGPDHEVRGMTLALWSPRALAMIGMRQGMVVPVPLPEGTVETLRLEAVLYQPEAQWRSEAAAEAGKVAAGAKSGWERVTLLSAYRLRRRAGAPGGGFHGGPGAA